jgi:hypothetical protein
MKMKKVNQVISTLDEKPDTKNSSLAAGMGELGQQVKALKESLVKTNQNVILMNESMKKAS